MPQPDDERDPVEVLAAEYIERRRRGESPSISEYVAQHPELEAEIKELFPAIAVMERLKVHKAEGSGRRVSLGGLRLERLGDFRIIGEIGRGGMGIVYEAFQESLARHVAVKVLPRPMLLDPKQLRRFQREAQTAAKLHHTNIVPVFGVGEHEGFHYIVMQLIRGVGLDAVLTRLRQSGDRSTGNGGDQDAAPPPMQTAQTTEVARLVSALLEGRLGPAQDADPSSDARSQQPAAPEASAASGSEEAVAKQPLAATGPATEDFHGGRDTKVDGQTDAARQSAAAAPTSGEACRLGPPYWRSVAAIGLQVAEALHYAHGHHTLHRDIKPGNLLLDAQGVVWITDFGLAKGMEQDHVTQTGAMVGTLRYMAPEQFSGQVDARSDMYSLGLTLYELLTLQPAFEDKSRSGLIRKITHDAPTRPRKLDPRIPRDLETIVLKAVAREPDDRYQSAGDLARDLQCFLEDRPIQARRTPAAERLWRWARRNRAVAALAASTFLLLVLVAVVASVGYVHTTQANIEEGKQRKKAEATSALALEVLDNIFQQFSPDRTVTPSDLTVMSESGEEIVVPVEPVLSKEAAALLDHMLVFYDRLAKQSGEDVKLRRKVAEANRRVGDIRQRLGNMEQAKAAYLRAVELYEEIAKGSPDDTELPAEIARIRNELGNIYGAANDREAERAAHLAALATLPAAPAEASNRPQNRYELARTYYLLGKSPGPGAGPPPPGPGGPGGPGPGPPKFALGPPGPPPPFLGAERGPDAPGPGPPPPPGTPEMRPGRALKGGRPRPDMPPLEFVENLRKAITLLEGLVSEYPSAPDYRHLLARCYRDLAGAPPFAVDPESSRNSLNKATAILEKLAADFPNVPDYRYDLSKTYATMPFPHLSGGNEDVQQLWRDMRKAKEERLRKALKISEQLVAEHPNVPDYAVSQVQIELGLAVSLWSDPEQKDAAEKKDAVEKTLRSALDLQSSLVRRYPDNASYQFMSSLVRGLLAKILRERDKLPEARSLLEASVKTLKQRLEKEPKDEGCRWILAGTYHALADVLQQMGDQQAATEAQREAEKLSPKGWGPGGKHGPPGHPPGS